MHLNSACVCAWPTVCVISHFHVLCMFSQLHVTSKCVCESERTGARVAEVEQRLYFHLSGSPSPLCVGDKACVDRPFIRAFVLVELRA